MSSKNERKKGLGRGLSSILNDDENNMMACVLAEKSGLKKRTIAIGDSLFHDIQGANNFEIDSVLVKSGIHKDLNQINNLIKNHQIKPTYIIDKFSI